MHIEPRDEKISSIYDDIKSEDVDLRPDFQRGEVWTTPKKKLLIDSIFRGWQVPPIHLVRVDHHKSEVLDGQQRLSAIRDFIENKFSIDGDIEPFDQEIKDLDGLKYKDLPDDKRKDFEKYRLKIFEITEYNQGEPGELFHRLNQSVKLTSAEARNAFFGSIREQISSLVHLMSEHQVDRDIIGFSNSRMAYNDLLTRVCYVIENKGLRSVINDKALTNRFRDTHEFEQEIIASISKAIGFFAHAKSVMSKNSVNANLTKATAFSWLYVLTTEFMEDVDPENEKILNAFINLEDSKARVVNNNQVNNSKFKLLINNASGIKEMLLLYIERASSRVTSIGSLLIRDLIINLSLYVEGYNAKSLSVEDKLILEKLVSDLSSVDCDVKFTLENAAEYWRK